MTRAKRKAHYTTRIARMLSANIDDFFRYDQEVLGPGETSPLNDEAVIMIAIMKTAEQISDEANGRLLAYQLIAETERVDPAT